MSGPNEVIHQSMRLRIMAALATPLPDTAIEFARLKTLVEATDGNLGAHIETLQRAGYVAVEKRFVGKKPQTRIAATLAGRRAFAEHVAYLREILDQGGVSS
jgi:DNA-binding MarR family transcriptional regulator